MPAPGVYTLKYAVVDTATSGANTLVAAVTDRTLVVVSYMLINSDDTNDTAVTFKSGSTALTGAIRLAASGAVSFNGSTDSPAFATAKGSALVLTLGAAQQISGHIAYLEV